MEEFASILDKVIDRLPQSDRQAILLRFFEHKSLKEVGEVIGVGENAARMRVNRALERLSRLMNQRGMAFSAAGLGTALTAQSSVAAPAGLATAVASAALGGAAATAAIPFTLTGLITMTKLKAAILGSLIAASVTTCVIIQQDASARLAKSDATWSLKSGELVVLTAARDKLSSDVGRLNTGAETPGAESQRLRNEVAKLIREIAANQAAQAKQNRGESAAFVLKPLTPFQTKELGMAKMNYSRQLLLEMIQYASEHQGKLPPTLTSFTAATSADAGEGQEEMKPLFELAYSGRISGLTNADKVIVVREKEPWLADDGRWVKAYGFADGHGEIHSEPNGDFREYERAGIPETSQ
jgi:hypothetical protein